MRSTRPGSPGMSAISVSSPSSTSRCGCVVIPVASGGPEKKGSSHRLPTPPHSLSSTCTRGWSLGRAHVDTVWSDRDDGVVNRELDCSGRPSGTTIRLGEEAIERVWIDVVVQPRAGRSDILTEILSQCHRSSDTRRFGLVSLVLDAPSKAASVGLGYPSFRHVSQSRYRDRS